MTLGFRLKGPRTSSSQRQQRTANMVSFCDYEIYLLFLLLVKFHVLGKSEIYSSVQRTLPCFLPCAILSLDTRFPNSKVAFNSVCISKENKEKFSPIRNRTFRFCAPMFYHSHRDSTVSEVYYEVH